MEKKTRTIHELKTDHDVFEESWRGKKKWEIRFNDRNYQVGDWIRLNETAYTGEEMKAGKPLEYTGREITFEIEFIFRGPQYGLKDGWVIMSVC